MVVANEENENKQPFLNVIYYLYSLIMHLHISLVLSQILNNFFIKNYLLKKSLLKLKQLNKRLEWHQLIRQIGKQLFVLQEDTKIIVF